MKTKTKPGNVKITATIAVIIVIVAITAGVIGYFIISQSQTQQTQQAQQYAAATQAPVMQIQTENNKQTQQQPPSTQISSQTGKADATYTNVEYGFQFTMPDDWMKNISNDYFVSIDTRRKEIKIGSENAEAARLTFEGKTMDKNWINTPKGYAEIFSLGVWNKKDLDLVLQSKRCMQKTDGPSECPVDKNWIIANNDKYTFVYYMPQEGPKDFEMYSGANLSDGYPYPYLFNKIKGGFKLIL